MFVGVERLKIIYLKYRQSTKDEFIRFVLTLTRLNTFPYAVY